MEDRPEYRIEERQKTAEECFNDIEKIVDAIVPKLKFEFFCVTCGEEIHVAKTAGYCVTVRSCRDDLGGFEVAIYTGPGNFTNRSIPHWKLSQRFESREAAEKRSRNMIADLFMALAPRKTTEGKG